MRKGRRCSGMIDGVASWALSVGMVTWGILLCRSGLLYNVQRCASLWNEEGTGTDIEELRIIDYII